MLIFELFTATTPLQNPIPLLTKDSLQILINNKNKEIIELCKNNLSLLDQVSMINKEQLSFLERMNQFENTFSHIHTQ